jgi:hypothetical protein
LWADGYGLGTLKRGLSRNHSVITISRSEFKKYQGIYEKLKKTEPLKASIRN